MKEQFDTSMLPLNVIRNNPAFADVVSELTSGSCPGGMAYRILSKKPEFMDAVLNPHRMTGEHEQIATGLRWILSPGRFA